MILYTHILYKYFFILYTSCSTVQVLRTHAHRPHTQNEKKRKVQKKRKVSEALRGAKKGLTPRHSLSLNLYIHHRGDREKRKNTNTPSLNARIVVCLRRKIRFTNLPISQVARSLF